MRNPRSQDPLLNLEIIQNWTPQTSALSMRLPNTKHSLDNSNGSFPFEGSIYRYSSCQCQDSEHNEGRDTLLEPRGYLVTYSTYSISLKVLSGSVLTSMTTPLFVQKQEIDWTRSVYGNVKEHISHDIPTHMRIILKVRVSWGSKTLEASQIILHGQGDDTIPTGNG